MQDGRIHASTYDDGDLVVLVVFLIQTNVHDGDSHGVEEGDDANEDVELGWLGEIAFGSHGVRLHRRVADGDGELGTVQSAGGRHAGRERKLEDMIRLSSPSGATHLKGYLKWMAVVMVGSSWPGHCTENSLAECTDVVVANANMAMT